MFTNQKKEHPIKKKVTNELLDQLLEDYQSLEDLIGLGGLLAELKQRLITRVMDAELTTHLGYDKNEKRPAGRTNARTHDGHSSKHLRSDDGDLEVKVPRDREGDLFIRSSSLMRSWRRYETMERSPTIQFTWLWALTWRGKRKC